MISRNRTPSLYICYAMYLFFFGLSLRKSADTLLSSFLTTPNEIMFLYGIGFNSRSKKDIIKEITGFGICYRRNSN